MSADEMSIGVDMGGTSIKFAVVQGTELVARCEPMPTADYPSPEAVVSEVGKRLRALMERYPACRAVGMGLPGFVDHAAGTVDSLTNVPGWYDVPIRRILEEETGLPAAVDNDANCMAYAEWKLGAGRGMQHLVCLTLGTGVGSGVVANGALLRGHLGAAGELGQVGIDYRGRIGHYGNRGALEDYIGNREIAVEAQIAYAAEGQVKTPDELTPLHLERAALAGCPVAAALWDDIARKLAACMLSCHYILNPQAFIIGGGVARAGELLFAPVRRYLKAQIYAPHFKSLQILPAQFGNEAGLIGAARLALEDAAAR
ncbi:MAG: ROK family protein [Akkermansiaceae bacterium]|nr:ROK family protein [Akkermansiaceae bacterium]